jgi:lipopolysaccharide/colanic/teichoic acid biosynthesis glycosyltransferase
MYKSFLKSFIDKITALVALLLLSPFFVLIGIIIKLESKGPVFFLQERLGLNGTIFKIYKFRSMTKGEQKMPDGKLFGDDPRITKVGHFIRKTSIDELPQLINIIKGEMSLIGPRPPMKHFPKTYEQYSDFEKLRFTVKPGLSGLAQIRCREIHEWSINIPIDVEYVKNYSLWYDFRLFYKSVFVFFKTDNIYRQPVNQQQKI